MESGGLCTSKKNNNIPYIEIAIREDRLNEDVVAHELLHAFFIKKGFGQTRANNIGDIPFGRITTLLHAIIEHKKIYEMQKTIGINIIEAQKHKANTIFKGTEKEPSIITYDIIINSLLLLDCIISTNEYKELYIDRIRTNFKHTYELTKILERELFSVDISNARMFRTKFISGLKVCDKYLSKHMPKSIQHFKLTENIAISFIPSEYQLQLKAEQVFTFRETLNNFIILSKKDNQACYIIGKPNDINILKNMTVEELMGRIDGLITIRR